MLNQSSMTILTILVCLIFGLLSSAEIFSSMAEMQLLINAEKGLTNKLKDLAEVQRKRIKYVKRCVKFVRIL
jgi:hypothetical protein